MEKELIEVLDGIRIELKILNNQIFKNINVVVVKE